jgi:hypothetical protein
MFKTGKWIASIEVKESGRFESHIQGWKNQIVLVAANRIYSSSQDLADIRIIIQTPVNKKPTEKGKRLLVFRSASTHRAALFCALSSDICYSISLFVNRDVGKFYF